MNLALPKVYGLIGYPVKHSFSPAMHNAAFRSFKINAEYRLFEIKPEELQDFLLRLAQENIHGLNVTVPYKEKVLDFVTLGGGAFYLKQIKAVNTIIRKSDILKGFNTDVPGFARALKQNLDPADKRVAILGAGGAGKAVAYVLADSKARDISIYDIDKVKSENVAKMIKALFPTFDIKPVKDIEQLNINNKDLLINATPVGLKDTDPCLVSADMLHKGLFIYDLIYNPAETKLLALAKSRGAGTSNGLRMLLYQGMLSFKIWTGIDAPEGIMRQALEEEARKCKP